jgi:hypothetical protein
VSGRAVGLLLAAGLLSACTGVQVEDQSLQFNQASGSIGTRLMLLNALRAAKGYPLQFSRLTSYTGQGTIDGGLNLDIPVLLNTFGSPSGARALGSIRPSSAFKTGISQVQLADLNVAEVQKTLHTPVRGIDYAYYRSQGWPKTLVNTILIEEIFIEPEMAKELEKASNAACGPGGSARKKGAERLRQVCAWLGSEQVKGCRDATEIRASPEGDVVRVYSNNPRRHCQYIAFQSFFASIRVLPGVVFDVDPRVDADECTTEWAFPDRSKKDAPKRKDKSKDTRGGAKEQQLSESAKEGKLSVDIGVNLKIADKDKGERDEDDKGKEEFVAINIPKDLLGLITDRGEAYALNRLRDKQLCLLKVDKRPLRVGWRSPERMVRFLGDVLAVQAFEAGDRRGQVQILDDNGLLIDMIRVERGRDAVGASSVEVDGPEGEKYAIPLPQSNFHKAHMSLQTLALVMEAFNQAVSGKALPQPATIFLPGG